MPKTGATAGKAAAPSKAGPGSLATAAVAFSSSPRSSATEASPCWREPGGEESGTSARIHIHTQNATHTLIRLRQSLQLNWALKL